MNKFLTKIFLFALLFGVLAAGQVFSQISLEVYMKDEGIAESNIVKPRIYITNTGSQALSGFYFHYLFTTDGKTPVLEDYYTPNSVVTLQSLGNSEYAVEYSFTGSTLNPGQTLPNLSGSVIGIHYQSWEVIDKTMHYSYLASSDFQLNGHILVYDSGGNLIYGSDGPQEPPTSTFFWHSNNSIDFNLSGNWTDYSAGGGAWPDGLKDAVFNSLNTSVWSFVNVDNNAGTSNPVLNNGRLEIKASGEDVWYGANQFVAANRSDIENDFDVTVQVVSQTDTDHWSKCGIMVANNITNLTSGGYAILAATPRSSGVTFQWASDPSAPGEIRSSASTNVQITFPVWLRMLKSAGSLRAFYKQNVEDNWTQVGSAQTPPGLSANSEIGLFSTSHNTGAISTALFDNLQVSSSMVQNNLKLSFGGTGIGSDLNSTLTADFVLEDIDWTGYTGQFDFGSYTLSATGNVTNASGYTVSEGTGSLDFTGAGTQIFIPRAGEEMVPILHSGCGTLQLSTNSLITKGFVNSGGPLDFNGKNIDVTSGGNFSITNGMSSTLVGLGGRTITVAGSASLNGLGSNFLNLNPSTAWSINAAGTLIANYAALANSNATGSTGEATNSVDGGGNTNWSIPQSNGLKYKYYEGDFQSMPDFSVLSPLASGYVSNFDISPRLNDDLFAMVFEGYLHIEFPGDHIFYINSDDGSILYIDGQEVVNNDGIHSVSENSGMINLSAGPHAIRVEFFENQFSEILEVKYQGPGINKQSIPNFLLTPDILIPKDPNLGLNYKYYHCSIQSVNELYNLTPVKTGATNTFDLTLREQNDQFGFIFEGYLNIEKPGNYTFYTNSDDGSKLLIDNLEIVDNDGNHSATEASGSMVMAKGFHSIKVLFFDNTGGEVLDVSYMGPGISKQAIPESKLYKINIAPSGVANGVKYLYFQGDFSSIPDFGALDTLKSGVIPDFSLDPRLQDDQFAFQYNSFIKINVPGTYTFYTNSDDGSDLFIGDDQIVNNDGVHGATEIGGSVLLSKGYHEIKISFFEKSGGEVLDVLYEGPNITKQLVPATVLFVGNPYDNPLMENYVQWNYKNKIVINTSSGTGANVQGDVINFPLLVRLDQTDFNFNEAKPDGADIRFSSSDGKTPLAYEIEEWDPEAKLAVVWVQVEKILGNNSTQFIYMYWGNSNVSSRSSSESIFNLSSGFESVWHLNDNSNNGTVSDANGVHNGVLRDNSQIYNTSDKSISGAISRAIELDGTDDFIGHNVKLPKNLGSISHWVKPDQIRNMVGYYESDGITSGIYNGFTSGVGGILEIHTGITTSPSNSWYFGYQDDDAPTAAEITEIKGGTPQLNQWAHVAVTWNRNGNASLYINGSLIASSDLNSKNLAEKIASQMQVGRPGDATTSRHWDGGIDEMRVSNVERSQDWIKLCYENQKPDQILVNIPNRPPVASNLTISGILEVGEKLTGSYTYMDLDSDPEGLSAIQWYLSDDEHGSGSASIPGATGLTYTVKENDIGQYISFDVTPAALQGASPGATALFPDGFPGPIGEATLHGEKLSLAGGVMQGKINMGNKSIQNAKKMRASTFNVQGQLIATEVRTKKWKLAVPDYVFGKKYSLRSLDSLSQFLSANGHHPNFEKAEIMEKEGVYMADMNMRLLKSIEELTLYAIQRNKELSVLQKKIKALEKLKGIK